jgi:hypothetical protein
MHKTRLEAFSDGVIAVALTIMVLDMKVPHGNDFEALIPVLPVFVCYVLSFVMVGIYWNNHHHMLHAAQHVNGTILWANLHLLFWLTLIPFVTGWMGENHFAPRPVALYGAVLLMAGVAYYILERADSTPRSGLGAGARARPRLQGQNFRRDLPDRDCALLRQPVGRRRPLCAGSPDVAGARSPHRKYTRLLKQRPAPC